MFAKILFILAGVLIVSFLYSLYTLQRKIAFSHTLAMNTVAYQKQSTDMTTTVLVLGDSTAVGVGATRPEDSVPALFAEMVGATYVENRGVSGARVGDLASQLMKKNLIEYDYILVMIGGNDVVARYDPQVVSQELRLLLEKLPSHQKLIVQMCGDVGTAPLLPWYVRSYYTKKNLAFHKAFETTVTEFGGIYVNLYLPKTEDPFVAQPEIYFSADGFHPSSAGYASWFEILKAGQFLQED